LSGIHSKEIIREQIYTRKANLSSSLVCFTLEREREACPYQFPFRKDYDPLQEKLVQAREHF